MQHHVQRDRAKQIGIRTAIAQVHKIKMISGRLLAHLLEFGA
jgi:hypothetical protein